MKKVLDIMKNVVKGVDFEEDANFIDEELIDSFDIIELISAIEDEYGIEIAGEDITPENFENIASIEALIDKYLNKR